MQPRASLALALALTLCAPGAAGQDDSPPNVLLIIADDQGYADLSCAGLNEDARTPNIDRLAVRGVRFTQAYATSPICNASRAGLMTGTYQQRFGTYWYGGKGLHDARYTTLAEALRARGYRTAYVGKFHYGASVHVPGNRSFPLEHGFESFFGFAGGRKHYLVHDPAAEAAFNALRKEHGRRGQSLRMGALWQGTERVATEGFSTELFGRRAAAFLEQEHDAPFFLVVAFNAVHNFTHQLPAEYAAEHDLGGHGDWDPASEPYYDWYQRGRYPNNPKGRGQYLGQLHFLDREVGRLLDALDAGGHAEDTVVVYVGDNGGSTPIYADNGPLRGSKYTLYEGGLRVPLIVAAPGAGQAGAVRNGLVSAFDLFPTLAALAGAEAPAHLDGRDLGRALRGEAEGSGHEVLFWDTGHEFAVRSGDWKLHVATEDRHARYEMVELELGTHLHDLAADPGEQRDLAAERPQIVERLLALHRDWRADLGE